MLTDKQCKNATCPPDKKRARFTDSLGLYLEVSPSGSKRWFWKTYFDGREGRMALGSYPAQSLADARKARDTSKLKEVDGVDPTQERKLEKLNTRGCATRACRLSTWRSCTTQKTLSTFLGRG